MSPDSKPTDLDSYLALLPASQRAALERVRDLLLATCPGATSHFGYGLPGFKYLGHPLLYLGATKNHCAIYGSVPAALSERFAGFDVSRGTIRFTPERPLPAPLVKALVKAKMKESEARWGPAQPRSATPSARVDQSGSRRAAPRDRSKSSG